MRRTCIGEPLSEARHGVGELYRAHARYVAGFLVRSGAPREGLEDLVQDVFLVAHRRGGYAPGAAKPTTWLAEIALRVLSNHRRRARRRPAQPSSDVVALQPSGGADPERAAATHRSLERVQRCLDGLDLDHRSVFILFELDGVSCSEIATALDVPVGTVYRRLHTARARVKAAYAELTECPDG